jgi:hypothetical protein
VPGSLERLGKDIPICPALNPKKFGSGRPAHLPGSAHRIGEPIHLSACCQVCALDWYR